MWSLCLWAQDVPRIRNFAPLDYAAQNQNWALAQSPEGWIYAGNNGGLLEMDGTRWHTFSLPDKQTVRAVAIGRNGEIFCGGFAEFGFWKTDRNGRFYYTSLSDQIRSDQLNKEEIWHILAGPDFVLFQSFSAIYKFDYQKITLLHPPGAIMFTRTVNGQTIVPVIGRGLYELLPDNTFKFVPGSAILADKIVQFMVSNNHGGVWIGTSNHGIFELRDHQFVPWNNPLNLEFQQVQLNKAIALQSGGWAIGTILNGAYILDENGRLRYHFNRENGLQNNTILAIIEDTDGNLWLGLDKGIDFIALQSSLTIFIDQTGKIGTAYTAAYWQNRLYIGTNQGVFVRENCTQPGACRNKFHLVEGTQGQVWQLQVIDNQLLCGHNVGMFRIENDRAQKISDVTGGWCAIPLPGHPDRLVQSTYTGLVLFRKDASGHWVFERRLSGFDAPLKKIAFDTLGNLWGAHPNRGLFRLHLSEDLTQVNAMRTYTREDGLTNDFKLDLAAFPQRLVVNAEPVPLQIVPTDQGVDFRPLIGQDIPQKWLSGMADDYFVVERNDVRLVSHGNTYPLLLTLVPGFENILPVAPDQYLCCLENGFAVLDRRHLLAQTSPRKTNRCLIRRIESADSSVFLPTENLEFSWRHNSLKFYFTVPYFERMPQVSWQLEGFSPQWSPWQSSPEKEFSNLSPGNYTLRVRTDTGAAAAVFHFRILPPWYRSVWAILVYIGLFFTLLWQIERFNRRRFMHQRQRLEIEKERELSVQRTAAEREKLLLEVENKSRELSNAALNLIRKNEVLQRLKDDLLAAKSDPAALPKIIRLIDGHLEGDHDWAIFEESFNRVHDDFFKRLLGQFPDLTPGDFRLAAYLKMNLSSKEIAPLLNISVRGVENKRYRLRRKLGLPEEANLTEFIINF